MGSFSDFKSLLTLREETTHLIRSIDVMLVNQTVRAGGETRRTHDSGTPKLFNIGFGWLKKKASVTFLGKSSNMHSLYM